jgi:ferritin-like metal-binding protein YciE
MLETLHDLFKDHLKDLYNAERQLLKALPKMAKASSSPELREAFESHLEETRTHVERLEEIASQLDFKPTGKHCKGMEGLIEEGKELLEEDASDAVLDAGLIAAAQKVEHYEICAYGTARAMAEQLGLDQVVEILQQTLQEEDAADDKLTELSEGGILAAAMSGDGEGAEAEQEDSNETGATAGKAVKKTAAKARATSQRGRK